LQKAKRVSVFCFPPAWEVVRKPGAVDLRRRAPQSPVRFAARGAVTPRAEIAGISGTYARFRGCGKLDTP